MFHQTLRSGSDSWGAFRLANGNGLSGDIANGLLSGSGGGDSRSLGLGLSGSNGGRLSLGLLGGLRDDSGSLLLLLLLGVLLASGLGDAARELTEDGATLLLLGGLLLLDLNRLLLALSLDGLGLGLGDDRLSSGLSNGGWGNSWGLLDLGSDLSLGLSGLLSGGGRLGTVLGTEELAKGEVLLLLAGSAGSSGGGLGLLSLSSGSGINGDRLLLCGGNGGSNNSLLDGLSLLSSGDRLVLCGDSWGNEVSLLLLLLGRLELLNEVAEDRTALGWLGLLLGGRLRSLLDLGLLYGSNDGSLSGSLRLGLLDLGDISSDDRGCGRGLSDLRSSLLLLGLSLDLGGFSLLLGLLVLLSKESTEDAGTLATADRARLALGLLRLLLLIRRAAGRRSSTSRSLDSGLSNGRSFSLSRLGSSVGALLGGGGGGSGR